MPKCIHCEEVYGDHLRRCPYCGRAQADPDWAGGPARGKARRRLRSRDPQSLRVITLAAFLLVLAGAGVVFIGMPGHLDSGGGTAAHVPPRTGRVPTGKDPAPPPLTDLLVVDAATTVGDEVVVEGRCNPDRIVRILVGGQPAVLSPDGDGFTARVPAGGADVAVVGYDIHGKPLEKKATPQASGGIEGAAVRAHVFNMANGQTVQAVRVRLKTGPGRGDSQDVELSGIVNNIKVGGGRLTLYRAPRGLVFLRVTESGTYSFLREVDGQEMILVPGGLSRRGEGKAEPHGPQHVIRLSPYLIDRTEVTCGQYARFLEYMSRLNDPGLRHHDDPGVDLRPAHWLSTVCPPGRTDLPVTGVSWYAAYAYARWVRGRLPTEAEWERAASGPLGRRYPWGEEYDPERCARRFLRAAASMPDGASAFGLLHMSGNAREWCEDRFDPRWYHSAARSDPRGPSTAKHRVVRGGSFLSEAPTLRAQFRDHVDPRERPLDVGFRVVMRWLLK